VKKIKFFVLFCLVAFSLQTVHAYATDKTKEEQKTLQTLSKKRVEGNRRHTTGKKTAQKKEKNSPVILIKKIIKEYRYDIASEISQTKASASLPQVVAIIAMESSGVPGVSSKKSNAYGLMQTLPGADRATGVRCKVENPVCQIKKGVRYTEHLLIKEHVPHGPSLLLAYKGGSGTLQKYKRSGIDPLKHPYVKLCVKYQILAQAILAHKI
jgi:hypothetical protein